MAKKCYYIQYVNCAGISGSTYICSESIKWIPTGGLCGHGYLYAPDLSWDAGSASQISASATIVPMANCPGALSTLPLTHYYPIEITCKAEPMTAGFSEGYKQQSSFESLKSVRLNYLVSWQDTDNLISMIDSASGVDTFLWLFRSHYTLKQWQVASFTQQIHDDSRLSELSLDLSEVRVGAPQAIPTGITPLQSMSGAELTPDSAPSISRSYLVRSPNLGYFPDRHSEPLNPQVNKIEFTSTLDLDTADSIDLLLERCRGIYPLLWQGSTYTCKDWRITYQPESATIDLTLETLVL